MEHILDHIMPLNTDSNIEVKVCRYSHSSTFAKARTYISTLVLRIYPYTNPWSGRFRNCGTYATGSGKCGSGRGRFFNGRGHVRGRVERGGQVRGGHVGSEGHIGGSNTYENGIDISYITCYCDDEEWDILRKEKWSQSILYAPITGKLKSTEDLFCQCW